MNRQIESMFKFHSGPYTVRVWRTAASVEDAMFHWPIAVHWHFNMTMAELAEQVAVKPNVAAVEVTDVDGKGVLIYPDWK